MRKVFLLLTIGLAYVLGYRKGDRIGFDNGFNRANRDD